VPEESSAWRRAPSLIGLDIRDVRVREVEGYRRDAMVEPDGVIVPERRYRAWVMSDATFLGSDRVD
jgi:hypothetical protein